MTDEERRIITGFVERVSGAASAQPARPASPWGGLGGSQPAAQPLPPVDAEADRLIGDLMARYPEARYRLTQMAFVQEAALVEMSNRVQQLEWEVENARRQGEAQQQNRGMFGGLFGGGANRPAAMPPRPQPQYPPGYNPQAMQRGGPGFLGTAMMTAAGVAGGLVLGNMLMSAFSGGGAAQAADAASGAGGFGQDAVPASSPWGGQDAAADQGGYQQDDAAGYDQGYSQDDGGGFDEEI